MLAFMLQIEIGGCINLYARDYVIMSVGLEEIVGYIYSAG